MALTAVENAYMRENTRKIMEIYCSVKDFSRGKEETGRSQMD